MSKLASQIVTVVSLTLGIVLSGSLWAAPGCILEPPATIKVGVIYPLTGPSAKTGSDLKNGVSLAADIVNNEFNLDFPLAKSKGINSLRGAKIQLVFGDSQGSPVQGRLEALRLINQEKVTALIGCYQSAVTAEASQAAEEMGIPFLAATSSAPSLTQRGFHWFFRTTPHEMTFVQNFYEFLGNARELKGTNIGTLAIVCENSVWGSEVAQYAEQYARQYNYNVVEKISYPADTTNVINAVRKLKDANPDIVMQASYVKDAILFMQTYKELKFSPDAILGDDGGFIEAEFVQAMGKDCDYILTREAWCQDLAETKPLAGIINQMTRERYSVDMSGNSARAFTGILVLADAIDRAGATEPEAIHKALLETDISGDKLIMPWDGVKFEAETHQNTLGKGIICQIIDGKYYTVWPKNLATKEFVWPMPSWEDRG